MTYQEFAFQYLPPPIRERFIKNIANRFWLYDEPISYPEQYVNNAFSWYHSPEGEVYWEDIYNHIRAGGAV